MQYESAGKRRDGTISREGSVALRRALIDLGIGLWLTEPAAKTYAHGLKDRGKHGGIIACALAHRANRIAYALVRDHASYDPDPLDLTTRRRTSAAEGRTTQHPFTTPVGSATLKGGTKGRIRCRIGLWRTHRVTPRLAWHPALRLHGSPNDAR